MDLSLALWRRCVAEGPAVTIAFTVTRHFPPRSDRPANLVGAPVPSVDAATALLYEMVLTAFLMFVITAVATLALGEET